MKITIYTITDCQFSKAEKEYLASHSLQYEEKNLETNKDFLTEMLAISNNFAGTPVTRVEKDDGSIAVLKGFTKEEFDTTFGFAETKPAEVKPETTLKAEEPVIPDVEATPPPAPVAETPSASAEAPADKAKLDELNSVLDKLEEKTTPAPTEVPPVQPSVDSQPSIPSIPDFPDATKTTA